MNTYINNLNLMPLTNVSRQTMQCLKYFPYRFKIKFMLNVHMSLIVLQLYQHTKSSKHGQKSKQRFVVANVRQLFIKYNSAHQSINHSIRIRVGGRAAVF